MMRWIHRPTIGSTRVIRKFALFPIRCNSGEAAWLERVTIKQRYSAFKYGEGWENLHFLEGAPEEQE